MDFSDFAIVFAAIALACAVGFHQYIWFISVGYGLSIAAAGASLFAVFFGRMNAARISACALLIAYGLRLAGYLFIRQSAGSSYSKKMAGEIKDGKGMKIWSKIALWLSCALLYFLMVSPIVFRFANGADDDAAFIAGLAVTAAGIILEAASDFQKARTKKENAQKFCSAGLFSLVRCPNYLGELILWTGVLIAGATALHGAFQWACALVGYLGIVYVMFSGARRLELRQDRVYGDDEEYQKYIAKTPIIIPFVPIYSVKKYKWLVA